MLFFKIWLFPVRKSRINWKKWGRRERADNHARIITWKLVSFEGREFCMDFFYSRIIFMSPCERTNFRNETLRGKILSSNGTWNTGCTKESCKFQPKDIENPFTCFILRIIEDKKKYMLSSSNLWLIFKIHCWKHMLKSSEQYWGM